MEEAVGEGCEGAQEGILVERRLCMIPVYAMAIASGFCILRTFLGWKT
jgi:hypothetical protein